MKEMFLAKLWHAGWYCSDCLIFQWELDILIFSGWGMEVRPGNINVH